MSTKPESVEKVIDLDAIRALEAGATPSRGRRLMGEKATICDVMAWSTPKWSPNIILPTSWANETDDPGERGPFFIIHCGDSDTALHVCELLNEECDRVIRTADDYVDDGDDQ